MKLFLPSLTCTVAACLTGSAHGQTLPHPSVQIFHELAHPLLAAIPGPLSVPLGVIGGIGALLLLRPRRGRR